MERADSSVASGSSAAPPTARVSASRRRVSRLNPWRRGKDARPRSPWARGRVLAALAVLTAGLLAFHSAVPNTAVRLGSLLEAFLPWLGLVVPVLLGPALLRRSALALAALLLPAAVWAGLFGRMLLGESRTPHDFLAVQHNVSDENADPAGTAAALADSAPDLIALEELTLSLCRPTRGRWSRPTPTTRSEAPSGSGRRIHCQRSARSTSSRRGSGTAGAAVCAPPSVPRAATSRCTWPICLPSASDRAGSVHTDGTKALSCWVRPSARRSWTR